MEWEINDLYMKGTYKFPTIKNKIYGFDLDNTIIKTKSGNKFAKNNDDWKFAIDNIIFILKMLQTDYTIIIITNQKGISSKKVDIDGWKEKIEKIVSILDIPILIYVAMYDNIYRKPFPSFWKMEEIQNCNFNESYYCGDAAGRIGDFSDTDLKFAINGKVGFIIPEDLSRRITPKMVPKYPNVLATNNERYEFIKKDREIVILIGIPGCGKSVLAKEINLKYDYVHINQDTLKTKKKCIDMTKKSINDNKNIIIDNTNMTNKSRKDYIDLATENKYNIRYVIFKIDKGIAKHLNYHRYYMSDGKNKLVQEIVYNKLIKFYEEPNGDIEYVNYVFDQKFYESEFYYYY